MKIKLQKRFTENQLMYFGVVTVFIEWVGSVLLLIKSGGLDLNKPISVVTVAKQPLPLIFGLTLSLAGLTYFLFTLSLRSISESIPKVGLISGIAFALTGWVPYRGDGQVADIIHNLAVYVAVAGYGYIVWSMRKHHIGLIQHASTVAGVLFLAATIAAFVGLFVFHRYVAVAQIAILAVAQAWTMLVIVCSRGAVTAGEPSV